MFQGNIKQITKIEIDKMEENINDDQNIVEEEIKDDQ